VLVLFLVRPCLLELLVPPNIHHTSEIHAVLTDGATNSGRAHEPLRASACLQ